MLKINNEEYNVLSSEVRWVDATYNKRKGYSILVDIKLNHNGINGYINFYVDFFDNRDNSYIINKKYNELPSELNSKIYSVEIFDTKAFIDLIDSNVTLEFGNIKDNKIYMKLDINDELIKIEYEEMTSISKRII